MWQAEFNHCESISVTLLGFAAWLQTSLDKASEAEAIITSQRMVAINLPIHALQYLAYLLFLLEPHHTPHSFF